MGCEGYRAISHVYDLLTAELDYEAWASYIERVFDRFLPQRPSLVLDLGCGTGRMTRTLSARGYDMIGVDGSEDMLSEAYAKGAGGILYLLQDMRSFELYGTVGAVVSCLDSINYLLTEQDVTACLRCVHTYLDPDGLFIFDVNTPHKFEQVYGDNAYILESETEDGGLVYCGWQNEYDKASGLCRFYLSLFEETEHGYVRSDEEQTERCYQRAALERMLTACGFEVLGFYGDYDLAEPTDTAERWYIVARAKK